MSWGKVKKINSDLTTPLNVLLWINDLKTYGKESYVYKSVDILMELAKYNVAVNDPVCNTLIVDGIQTQGIIGKFFKEYLNSDNSGFDSVRTLYDFAKVDSLVTEVFSNSNLATLVYSAPSFAGVARSSDTSISDVLYSNDVFTDGLIARELYIVDSGVSNSTWVNILDRTNFIDKLLLPENRGLLKKCMGAGSSGGKILEGLCRSPKGLNRFLKSGQPPDVTTYMHSTYTQSSHHTFLNLTLSSALYFTKRVDFWDSAKYGSTGVSDYFNGTSPSGTTTEITEPDNSIALVKDCVMSGGSSASIRRIAHPTTNWESFSTTTKTIDKYVAVGGFFLNPPPEGSVRFKYRIYVPK